MTGSWSLASATCRRSLSMHLVDHALIITADRGEHGGDCVSARRVTLPSLTGAGVNLIA